jgi:hypothetical protein
VSYAYVHARRIAANIANRFICAARESQLQTQYGGPNHPREGNFPSLENALKLRGADHQVSNFCVMCELVVTLFHSYHSEKRGRYAKDDPRVCSCSARGVRCEDFYSVFTH